MIPSFVQKDISLSQHTSWQVGGPADFFGLPSSLDEIKEAWSWALKQNLPVHFLGGGSNVLVSDAGLRGLVLGLKKFSEYKINIQGNNFEIHCQSGLAKSELLKIFLKQKLAPALFLAGLPGDVGGGIVMNAGVAENFHPREFGEMVKSFWVLRPKGESWEEKEYGHKEVDWTYRHSKGWQPGLITKVILSWANEPNPEILNQVKEANRVRLSKQPLDWPSCGSVFVNPPGGKAAQLIDQCGLKGFRVGDAQVSTKHANFIVNLGKAKAQDIRDVITHVQKIVLEKKSVSLKTEVVFLGFDVRI